MEKWKKIAQTALPFVALAAAFAMIAYGVGRGEMEIVLNKAINICLECVGLG